MPDITKCKGINCKIKENCYRFTAPDSEFMQSYYTIPPIKNNKCYMFWDNNIKEKNGKGENNI